jgi:hypothetical protein
MGLATAPTSGVAGRIAADCLSAWFQRLQRKHRDGVDQKRRHQAALHSFQLSSPAICIPPHVQKAAENLFPAHISHNVYYARW